MGTNTRILILLCICALDFDIIHAQAQEADDDCEVKCPPGYERETPTGNTYEGRCGRCVKIDKSCGNGYFPEGNDCKPCPCPGSSWDYSRQFGTGCYRDRDGQPTCVCKPGYSGRNCQYCAPGGHQNPYYPYECHFANETAAICPMGRCPQVYPPPCNAGPACDFNNYALNYNFRPQNCFNCPPSCFSCGNLGGGCQMNMCPPQCMNCRDRNYCPQPNPQPPYNCPSPPVVIPPVCPPPPPYPIIPPNPPCPSIPEYNCTQGTCPDLICPPNRECPDCRCPNPCPANQCPQCPACNCPPYPSIPSPICGNSSTIIIQQNITLNIPCLCDIRGTEQSVAWTCMCKDNAIGARCDKCLPGFFGLRGSNKKGCSKCFCSGVSDRCSSGGYYYSPIKTEIIDENHGFTLTDRMEEYTPGGFRGQELWYSYPRGMEYKTLYWRLPATFLGNRITSYGGLLKFGRRYVNGGRGTPIQAPDVILIGGNGMALYWSSRFPIDENIYQDVSILLNEEANWLALRDNATFKANRWNIMQVLVNLEQILLRASHSTNMRESFVRDISLDSVSSEGWNNRLAIEIEKCECPNGYSGLSCESCAPGYYSDKINSKWTCKPCPCGKHSLGCYLNDENDVVCKCTPSWNGPRCSERETISVSLRPSNVFDCSNKEITFTCEVTSSLDTQFEFSTNLQDLVPAVVNASLGKSTRQAKISLSRYLTEFTCRVRNALGKVIAQVTSTIVISEESDCIVPIPSAPNYIYINIQPSTPICLNLGASKDIGCNASSVNNPNVQVFWSREGEIAGKFRNGVGAGVVNGVNVLRIVNAQAEDEGEYICSASDGSNVQSVSTIIIIKDANKTAQMSNDAPSATYSRSEVQPPPIRTRGDERRVVAETLPFFNTSVIFEANNNDQKSPDFPSIKIIPTSPHRTRVGQRVYFECEADGNPNPNVTWSRLINGVESIVLSASTPNAVFEINPATKADEGKYTCKGINELGSEQKSLQLFVDDPVECEANEFRCKSADQCVSIQDRCDSERDCRDGSDELHCSRRARHLRNFFRRRF